MRRTTITVAAAASLALLVSGCSSSANSAGDPGVEKVEITLTDAGCDPARIEVPAGPTTFKVINEDAGGVTEAEVLKGDTILGERENLTPGLTGEFSITLKPGTYTTYCPGGDHPKGELIVTGADSTETTAPPAPSAAATTAVNTYRGYVETEAAALVTGVTAFVNAVNAGNLAEAKRLFPAARRHYESIEPIAESFGDLDLRIDARANDVPVGDFRGFHRIERQMWERANLEGMTPVANTLLADVKDLRARIPGIELEPAQLANGAVELLNEVATSKITGEEDRYSHTDLWDFEANLEGAKRAYEALRPIVEEKDPALAEDLDRRFAVTEAVLAKYAQGDGYVLYTTLTRADTRAMAAQVNALADALAQVAPLVIAA
jgi:iron uptake system component EfeO